MALSLTQTTLSGSISASQTTFAVASATNLSAPVGNVFQKIYVIGPGQPRGELMQVVAVSGTQVTVMRLDEYKAAYPSGSLVLIGPIPPQSLYFEPFQTFDPAGTLDVTATLSAAEVQVTPWVNVANGRQWLFSTVLNAWVPGWNNDNPKAVTAAVASAASALTPSGPLFHVTGTAAITGITTPIGFTSGSFTIIPDGVFTWTTGDGSIALGGTAVVNKPLTFTWDGSSNKWLPSYTA